MPGVRGRWRVIVAVGLLCGATGRLVGETAREDQGRSASASLAASSDTVRFDADGVLAPLPRAPEHERELLGLLGEAWSIQRSAHCVVAHRGGGAGIVLEQAETTYARVIGFCGAMDLPLWAPRAKLEVIACQTWASYQRVVASMTGSGESRCGVYLPWVNRSVVCDVRASPEVSALRERITAVRRALGHGADGASEASASARRRLDRLERRLHEAVERVGRMVVQHELAHHVLYVVGIHRADADQPAWLVEGLATLFEVPLDVAWDGGLPPVNQERLADWRRARASGALPGVGEVLSGRGPDGKNPQAETNFYAQAWAMVYYLSKRHSDRFTAYVRALLARRPGRAVVGLKGREEFIRIFGPIDKVFTSQWENCVSGLPSRRGEEKR